MSDETTILLAAITQVDGHVESLRQHVSTEVHSLYEHIEEQGEKYERKLDAHRKENHSGWARKAATILAGIFLPK
jgi:hypothetical protein